VFQAVGVLRNLTVKMENKLTVVQEGALPPLVRLLESPEEEVQMQVAVVLRNLAVNNSNKVKMVQADALRPLLKLLKSPNVRVQEQSCACVQVRHYLCHCLTVSLSQEQSCACVQVRHYLYFCTSKAVQMYT